MNRNVEEGRADRRAAKSGRRLRNHQYGEGVKGLEDSKIFNSACVPAFQGIERTPMKHSLRDDVAVSG